MSKFRRRRPRPGSYLAPVDASPFIAADSELAEMDRERAAAGWTRKATVRPYLSKRGHLTLRFVWRKREKRTAWTDTLVVRIPLEAFSDVPT